MKKKLLPLALAAATGLVASTAQAVFVNPEGHGQVLLYPYYTVEGGNDTYINLVNTTNEYKAVKVRILEAMNSQEVLDFNLYLSPQDHWSAVITADANGAGAVIRTADTSCTVPKSLAATAPGVPGPSVPFRDTTYSADSVNGLERTREGYVEIIEMGVLTDAVADQPAVLHGANNIPGDCNVLTTNWQAGGKWDVDEIDDMDVPTGGLYGYGVIINVADGTDATYDAVALDKFVDVDEDSLATSIHAEPGSILPSLAQATPIAHVLDGSAGAPAIIAAVPDSGLGIDAVSTVLQSSSIMNDFVLEPSINGATDWVVTFPTKKVYVNKVAPADAPFTNVWSTATSTACEEIGIVYYNREEQGLAPSDLDFSPKPPAGSATSLCHEANIISFNNSDVLSGTSRVQTDLTVVHENGWMEVDFTTVANRAVATNAGDFEGLPVIGFAVQKYVNGDVNGTGVLSNYAGSVTHKAKRSIIIP